MPHPWLVRSAPAPMVAGPIRRNLASQGIKMIRLSLAALLALSTLAGCDLMKPPAAMAHDDMAPAMEDGAMAPMEDHSMGGDAQM